MGRLKTIHIYMKSGNVLTSNCVVGWKIESRGNTISKIELEQSNATGKKRIVLTGLDFSQIEGIVEES